MLRLAVSNTSDIKSLLYQIQTTSERPERQWQKGDLADDKQTKNQKLLVCKFVWLLL